MIFAHKALQYFYIHHNLITHMDPMILPSGKLWALTHLYASNNLLAQVTRTLLFQFESLVYLDISYNILQTMPFVSGVGSTLGLYSLSGKTSYHQISWSLEAAKLDVAMVVSFWNLTGTSAALLRLEKFKPESRGFETSRDLAVRHLTT